jgi:hypothetical protein
VKTGGSWAIAAALLGSALLACEHHRARVASGFTRGNVSQLRVGLPVEDMLRVLGPPLERYPEDPEAIDARYVYATHSEWATTGGGWHFYSAKEPTCIVAVSAGAIGEVFVSGGHASCTCTRTACPESWLDECASGIPE